MVDLDTGRVAKLVDTGAAPVARDTGDFTGAEAAAPIAPSPRVALDGNTVHWKNWSFHFRLDPRVGPILSLVRYRDGQRDRMVLYRGSLSEIFVPYMDPDPGWSWRSYTDAGDWGLGAMSSPLAVGIDCPSDARLVDVTLADQTGAPQLLQSRMCLFERNTEKPAVPSC